MAATVERTVLKRFPAGGPRGSWPAEDYAQHVREQGIPAEVVMNLDADAFIVFVREAVAS